MLNGSIYDIVIIGNYTKDTIVSSAGTRPVDGGGFNYGAHVAAMMGLKRPLRPGSITSRTTRSKRSVSAR